MSRIDELWNDHPVADAGTREQWARFLGLTLDEMETIRWDALSDVMRERFGMEAAGGTRRFPGTAVEEWRFRFLPPRQKLFVREGIAPGGAWISADTESSAGFIGSGRDLDEAALSATLVLWELTMRRSLAHG